MSAGSGPVAGGVELAPPEKLVVTTSSVLAAAAATREEKNEEQASAESESSASDRDVPASHFYSAKEGEEGGGGGGEDQAKAEVEAEAEAYTEDENEDEDRAATASDLALQESSMNASSASPPLTTTTSTLVAPSPHASITANATTATATPMSPPLPSSSTTKSPCSSSPPSTSPLPKPKRATIYVTAACGRCGHRVAFWSVRLKARAPAAPPPPSPPPSASSSPGMAAMDGNSGQRPYTPPPALAWSGSCGIGASSPSVVDDNDDDGGGLSSTSTNTTTNTTTMATMATATNTNTAATTNAHEGANVMDQYSPEHFHIDDMDLFPSHIKRTYLGPEHVLLFPNVRAANFFLPGAEPLGRPSTDDDIGGNGGGENSASESFSGGGGIGSGSGRVSSSLSSPEGGEEGGGGEGSNGGDGTTTTTTTNTTTNTATSNNSNSSINNSTPPSGFTNACDSIVSDGLVCPRCSFLLASSPTKKALGLKGRICVYGPLLTLTTSVDKPPDHDVPLPGSVRSLSPVVPTHHAALPIVRNRQQLWDCLLRSALAPTSYQGSRKAGLAGGGGASDGSTRGSSAVVAGMGAAPSDGGSGGGSGSGSGGHGDGGGGGSSVSPATDTGGTSDLEEEEKMGERYSTSHPSALVIVMAGQFWCPHTVSAIVQLSDYKRRQWLARTEALADRSTSVGGDVTEAGAGAGATIPKKAAQSKHAPSAAAAAAVKTKATPGSGASGFAPATGANLAMPPASRAIAPVGYSRASLTTGMMTMQSSSIATACRAGLAHAHHRRRLSPAGLFGGGGMQSMSELGVGGAAGVGLGGTGAGGGGGGGGGGGRGGRHRRGGTGSRGSHGSGGPMGGGWGSNGGQAAYVPCTFLLLDTFTRAGGVDPSDVLLPDRAADVANFPVPSFLVWYRGCRVLVEGTSQHFRCVRGAVVGLDLARYVDIVIPRIAHEARVAFSHATRGYVPSSSSSSSSSVGSNSNSGSVQKDNCGGGAGGEGTGSIAAGKSASNQQRQKGWNGKYPSSVQRIWTKEEEVPPYRERPVLHIKL